MRRSSDTQLDMDVDGGSALVDFLKIVSEREVPFEEFFHSAQNLTKYDKEIQQIMDLYINTITSRENLMDALEWASMTNNKGMLKRLIQKNRAIGKENQEWADLYEKLLAVKEGKYTPEDTIGLACEKGANSLELRTLLIFMICYVYFHKRQFQHLERFVSKLSSNILKMPDSFIKESFNWRLSELLFHLHWRRNATLDLTQARDYGRHLVATAKYPRKKAGILHYLGLTYLYESYDDAIRYCHQSIAVADEVGDDGLCAMIKRQTIPFISAYWKRYEHVEMENIEPDELAHIELSKGNWKRAVSLLTAIKEETGTLSAFQLYYLGKALEDRTLLQESFSLFTSVYHDYFYATLPEAELK